MEDDKVDFKSERTGRSSVFPLTLENLKYGQKFKVPEYRSSYRGFMTFWCLCTVLVCTTGKLTKALAISVPAGILSKMANYYFLSVKEKGLSGSPIWSEERVEVTSTEDS